MRIIQFPFDPVPPMIIYPDDIDQFGITQVHEGMVVGEYFGADASIEDYLGVWPIPQEQI